MKVDMEKIEVMREELDNRKLVFFDLLWIGFAVVMSLGVWYGFLSPLIGQKESFWEGVVYVFEAGADLGDSFLLKLLGIALYTLPFGIIAGNVLFVLSLLMKFGKGKPENRGKLFVVSLAAGTLIVWTIALLVLAWFIKRVLGGRNAEETLANAIKLMR